MDDRNPWRLEKRQDSFKSFSTVCEWAGTLEQEYSGIQLIEFREGIYLAVCPLCGQSVLITQHKSDYFVMVHIISAALNVIRKETLRNDD